MTRTEMKARISRRCSYFRRIWNGDHSARRLRCLTVTLAILLLAFTACRAVDKDNQFEMPSEDTATLDQIRGPETIQETIRQTEGGAESTKNTNAIPVEDEQLSVPYQYGNRQSGAQSGNFMDYGDKVIFGNPYRNGFLLYTVDKETLEVQLLCQNASCGHNSARCVSYNKIHNLEQYDGKIYVTDGVLNGPVLELKDDHFEKVTDGNAVCFWHAHGNLYLESSDLSLLCYENGRKEPKTIVDEFIGYGSVVYQNYIYGTSGDFNVFRVDLSEEHPKQEILRENACCRVDVERGQFYFVDLSTNGLYSCDMDFQNAVKLTEEPIVTRSITFDEDYLYTRPLRDGSLYGDGCHEIIRMAKNEPGKWETVAELPGDAICDMYTVPHYDKLFVVTESQVEMGNADYEIYAVAKDGSQVVKLELPEI